MALPLYLAMTGREIARTLALPAHIGWLACHFSPYGVGITGLPTDLPPGSLITLNDSTPMQGHDGDVVAGQLASAVEAQQAFGVLLDFQRPKTQESVAIADRLIAALPCPVAISEAYAQGRDCPVFLSVPTHRKLSVCLSAFQGREIWLDASPAVEQITLTPKGCSIAPLQGWDWEDEGFTDSLLHCHYRIKVTRQQADFRLWRNETDLTALMEEAETLGVRCAVGLYQEWMAMKSPRR